MNCRPVFYVQSTEDFTFMRADGEGGVMFTPLITNAQPFTSPDAAFDAIEDHCGGCGVVFSTFAPEV